jgi:hypothetical protein
MVLNLSVAAKNLFFKTPLHEYRKIANILYNKYPNTQFSIYDYKYKMYTFSTGLSLIMSFDGKVSDEGKNIGVSCHGIKCPSGYPVIVSGAFVINELPSRELDKKTWANVNPSGAYDDLIGWLNKNQLKSTFSLKDYIIKRLGI